MGQDGIVLFVTRLHEGAYYLGASLLVAADTTIPSLMREGAENRLLRVVSV